MGKGLRLPIVLALVTGLVGSVFAGAASAGDGQVIEMQREGPRVFFSPKTTTIDPGETLTIKNATNPQRIGPHTFSLVKRRLIPDSKEERQTCFNKGHICRKIARWHQIDPSTGQVGLQSVDVGLPGWDKMGTKRHKGDSWYTETKGETEVRNVSAAPGRTLYFMCAIHPNMKGKVVVNEL